MVHFVPSLESNLEADRDAWQEAGSATHFGKSAAKLWQHHGGCCNSTVGAATGVANTKSAVGAAQGPFPLIGVYAGGPSD